MVLTEEEVVTESSRILRKEDYNVVVDEREKNYCFSIVGEKKGKMNLIVKYFHEVDDCTKSTADEIKKLATVFEGTPILIGSEIGGNSIQERVFYKRFSIYTVGFETFKSLIGGTRTPMVYTDRGGVYAKLNREKLRKSREEKELSFGDLARLVGVSRRTIYEYERGRMDATLETALALEHALKCDLIETTGLLLGKSEPRTKEEGPKKGPLKGLFEVLRSAGYNPLYFRKTPFDVAAKSSKKPFKSLMAKTITAKTRISDEEDMEILTRLSNLIDALLILIATTEIDIEENYPTNDVRVVTCKDLKDQNIIEELI